MYSLFVGGLVDKHGHMKLLSLLPIFGVFLSDIVELINYAFINQLPLGFFYAKETLIGIFGGEPVYYLGIYGYGAAVVVQDLLVIPMVSESKWRVNGFLCSSHATKVRFS